MKLRILIFAGMLLPATALCHGEDQPGPHGGSIKMPGAFHTEVLVNKDNSIQVYLLDMNFKNPTIKESKVAITVKTKSTSSPLECAPMGDHFHCHSDSIIPNKGSLIVKATREGAVGNEAKYELPLKYSDKKKKKSQGHHHH